MKNTLFYFRKERFYLANLCSNTHKYEKKQGFFTIISLKVINYHFRNKNYFYPSIITKTIFILLSHNILIISIIQGVSRLDD